MLSLLIPKRKAQRMAAPIGQMVGAGPVMTKAGTSITPQNAFALSLVWCATAAIAETAALCPMPLYRKDGKDGREEATGLRAYDLMKSAPNLEMDSAMFRESRTSHQVNWGGGFAEIQRAGTEPVALHPVHPARVFAVGKNDKFRTGDQVPEDWYKIRNEDGKFTYLSPQNMLHVPGRHSDDGVWARGVFAFAAEELGIVKATGELAADYFGGGAQPRGILTILGLKKGDNEVRNTIRKDWEDTHRAGHRRVAILGAETSYVTTGSNLQDSQWAEAEQLNAVRVARWYRLPPHMLYDLTKSSFASVEAMGMEFLVFGLMPWLKKWEGQASLKLLTPSQRKQYYYEHTVTALLRGDIKTRMESYQKGLMQGIFTINEVRAMENLPRAGPDADKLFLPANMVSLEIAAKQQPNPKAGGLGSDQSGAQPADPQRDFAAFAKENPDAVSALKEIEVASGGDMGKVDLRPASRDVLHDTLTRMGQIEANTAQRTVDSKGDFPRWLDEFYVKHAKRISESLAPCAKLVELAGGELGEAWPVAICEHNKREMTRAYNGLSKSAFREKMGRWAAETADRFSEAILGGVS